MVSVPVFWPKMRLSKRELVCLDAIACGCVGPRGSSYVEWAQKKRAID